MKSALRYVFVAATTLMLLSLSADGVASGQGRLIQDRFASVNGVNLLYLMLEKGSR